MTKTIDTSSTIQELEIEDFHYDEEFQQEFIVPVEEQIEGKFDVEELKRLSPEPKGENIEFKEWLVVPRSDVYVGTHEDSTQTRSGITLEVGKVREYKTSIEKYYEYRSPQPSLSPYNKKAPDGEFYKYILRNGRHRWYATGHYSDFPCSLIDTDKDEYWLKQFGTTSNNEDSSVPLGVPTTQEDVKRMIRIGFDSGCIAKDQDLLVNRLENTYPKIRARDREVFAAEILKETGNFVSWEPYGEKKLKLYLKENFPPDSFTVNVRGTDNVDAHGRIGFVWAHGHPTTDTNTLHAIGKSIIKNPTKKHYTVSYLKQYNQSVEYLCENKVQLRNSYEGSFLKHVREYCVPLVDLLEKGLLEEPQKKWLPQDNSVEKKQKWY